MKTWANKPLRCRLWLHDWRFQGQVDGVASYHCPDCYDQKVEHEMKKLTAEDCNIDTPCPKCGATDLGDVILPEENPNEWFGPQGTRWRRHIGIEDPMIYDGVSWWKCKDCGHIWKRFPWGPEYEGN